VKKLGIIGGAGPLASALFYETLVHECYRLKQQLPEMLLLNYPFIRGLTPKEKKKNRSLLRDELLHCLGILKQGGAQAAVLVCNTLHLELALLPQHSLRFFPIPDLVLKKIKKKGGKRLLLLGTQNTCLSSLYQECGLTIFCPTSQRLVDEAIDRVLEGKVLESDSRLISELINTFPEEIDGVILGCTDLPVLHHRFPLCTNKIIYDSVKIPAQTILRYL
jgi:aspartate racemase